MMESLILWFYLVLINFSKVQPFGIKLIFRQRNLKEKMEFMGQGAKREKMMWEGANGPGVKGWERTGFWRLWIGWWNWK